MRYVRWACTVEILGWIVENIRQEGMSIKQHESRVFEAFADVHFIGDLQPKYLINQRCVFPHLVSDCGVVTWLEVFVFVTIIVLDATMESTYLILPVAVRADTIQNTILRTQLQRRSIHQDKVPTSGSIQSIENLKNAASVVHD